MNSRQRALIGLSLTSFLLLSGCGKTVAASAVSAAAPVATETSTTQPDERALVEELSLVVTASEIYDLEQYPNLKKADLTGSTCYSAIEIFSKSHPDIEIIYSVFVGQDSFPSDSDHITVTGNNGSLDALIEAIPHLRNLKSLTLSGTVLSFDEMNELADRFPELFISYTVELLGEEYPPEQEELDLSDLTPDQVDSILPSLSRLKNLSRVELMKNGSCKLSKSDVSKLVHAAPDTVFHYTFDLFGRKVSTDEETITFENLRLTADRESEIREALDILSGCSYLILDNCGLDSETLAAIRADYDRTELVWRIHFGKYSALTNTDTILAVYNVFDDTVSELKYCKDVKYMDIGHNNKLTDLSFIGYMPDLEILIASQSGVSDLSGFENCKKLEFLELAYCGNLADLTPLSGCVNLKNLNVCYTKVSKLLALDGLPLERLSCKQTRVPANEQKIFKELHPDCLAMFTGTEPYAGAGWRYIDNGIHYTEIYKKVREVFDYDSLDAILKNND